MKPFTRLFLLCMMLGLSQADLAAQALQATGIIKPPENVTMAAGKQFAASRHKQFWWGKHWRKEWLTPIAFNILNMDTVAGGLSPKKEGGGKETKSLRLLGTNGKEYVLRTID